MSRQFPRTATALAVLATGLLTGWNAPLAVARQFPDTWSAEHRQDYGNASHLVSDLLLGADPAIGFPTEAAIGRYYRLTVPVAVGDRPATLAGWIDFGHTGRFDPAERVQTEIRPGADTATLEWTVPPGAVSGVTWARLRIGRDAGQLVTSGGFADSGEVIDQQVELTVGAARPEIAEPLDGAVLSDDGPRISGGGALPGAGVEVREGDTALCTAEVERGGGWSCRPGTALAAGPHVLTPVETTRGGVVLRGEPVRVTVRTAPPVAPTLSIAGYTNDPGLRLTGTGEAGSTVSVVDQGSADELCITGVPADGRWSCLPVENLTDGKHLLTPVAVDPAGNRTAGQPVALVVDTALPDRPVLTSPASGETVRVIRPRLAGRAAPGSDVLVTVQAGAGTEPERRTVLCGATAALDGSWTCTANRDLVDGEQWLIVTATDRAGNGTSADPVPVRVAGVAAVPTGAVPTTAVPSRGATPSPATASPTGPGSARPGAPVASGPSSAVVPSNQVRPSPTEPSPARPSPSAPVPAAAASPSPSFAVVPIVVPPLGARPVTVGPTQSGPASSGPSAKPSGPAKATPSAAAPVTSATSSASAAVAGLPASARPVVPTPSTVASASPLRAPGLAASPTAVAAVKSAPSAAGPADPTGSDEPAGGASRPPAAPPAAPSTEPGQGASGRPAQSGWRGGLAGVLLVLTGLGLITRRVFSHRTGASRR
ncbi:Ig-like domain-containing protein [Kitasatospora sp. NPDC091335]|uniref:Ig-like domain-containing protein n=1 Tax=Kitasatospora sp. NPDC091335 TaxID=3364085 RepID=UPI0037FA505C